MKALAVVCLVIFVITLPVSLALLKLETIIFDSRIYEQALSRVDIESQVPDLVARQVVENSSADSSHTTQALELESFQTLMTTLVPPAYFREAAEGLLRDGLEYAQLQRQSVSVSLQPFKQGLLAPEGYAAFKHFLVAYPKCTGRQLEEMLKESRGKPDHITTLCSPPGEFHSAHGTLIFSEFLPGQIEAFAGTIPQEVLILQAPPAGQDFRPRIEQVREWIRLSWMIPAAFLLLATALAVRSLPGWLGWWGFPLLIAGALGLAAGKTAGPLLHEQLSVQLGDRLAGLPSILNDFLLYAFGSMLAQSLAALAERSLPFVIAGAVLSVAAFFLNRRAR
jgi:hypothetical protein